MMYNGKRSTTGMILTIILTASILSAVLAGCGSKLEIQQNNSSVNMSSSGAAPSSTAGQAVQQSGQTEQSGQAGSGQPESSQAGSGQTGQQASSGDGTEPVKTSATVDLASVKPNEDGKIIVVMFHNFLETYKKGDKAYTTTFDAFRSLLGTLYDSGYRLINLKDFLNDNINVPAGYIPMVFTFDDGTAGQFNLVEKDGKLVANPQSAVGVMEEFNRRHPDFGLKGTFYVNLGNSTFAGSGTLAQRLKYLIDEGFEIGNHTYDHINLQKAKSAEEIQKEIGGNQQKLNELVPGYTFTSFSLPYGEPSKGLTQYVISGQYQGASYDNKIIVNVGWDPSVSPASKKFNPLSTHRVRASGITPVDADLAWWLKNLTRAQQYVSDGDPNTITVPKAKEADIDVSKLNGKKLNVY